MTARSTAAARTDQSALPAASQAAPATGGTSRTPAGDLVTALVLPVFETNGEFLAAARDIAEPAGLTPAGWQVLGATLDEALTVAEIARRVGLGLARQSVQRTADLLVEQGWAQYRDNPRHRRAKLLGPTAEGRRTIGRFREAQHAWADAVGARVAEQVGLEQLETARGVLRILVDASRDHRGAPTGDDPQVDPDHHA